MKTLSIILAIALLAPSAFGRIGETEAQIEKRYGKPLSSDKTGLPLFLYRKNDMQIGVVFVDGKSVAEFYSRHDKRELSQNEINLLLEANAFNGTWTKSANLPTWTLESGLTATYNRGSLVINTKEFEQASEAERKKREAATLKDF